MGELNHIASAVFQAWNTGERGKVQYQKEVKNNIYFFLSFGREFRPIFVVWVNILAICAAQS